MNHLFTPITLKSMTLRNRIVMAPMCMYSSDQTGFVKPFHMTHYETRAMGGTALVILEATAVEARGRISAEDLGIWSDAHVEGLKQLTEVIHRHGAKAGIQLAHAGRKCGVPSEDMIAPSPVWFEEAEPSYRLPREMNFDDIHTVIEAFKQAARRAHEAGFDFIELHGAHGYLINEYLSPLTNFRKDQYADGTLFLEEILTAVHSVWPSHLPLGLRISAEDYAEGGNLPEYLAEKINRVMKKMPEGQGIDLINVSSGGVVPARINVFDGYQTRHAEIVRQLTQIPVMSGGRIKTAEMADEIIRNNRAELVFLGRQLLIDPYFPLHAAVTLKQEIDYAPVAYERWKTGR